MMAESSGNRPIINTTRIPYRDGNGCISQRLWHNILLHTPYSSTSFAGTEPAVGEAFGPRVVSETGLLINHYRASGDHI